MLWVLIRIASQAILMSTHNICFYGELTKIVLHLSSNTLLICSTGLQNTVYPGLPVRKLRIITVVVINSSISLYFSPLHIAVVHKNNALVKRFVEIMTMSGKSVDRYNKLMQVFILN